MKKRTALIDGDIILFRIAFTCDTEEEAWKAADKFITHILETTNSTDYIGVVGVDSSTNLRYSVDATYKQGRPTERPGLLYAVKNYLISKWNFLAVSILETDDVLSALQFDRYKTDSIICSGDKDLLQVPGWHYRFGITRHGTTIKNEEILFVKVDEAKINLFRQLLVGDSTDNIKGAKGIGVKTAEKIIAEKEKEIIEAKDFTNLLLPYYDGNKDEIEKTTVLISLTREIKVLNYFGIYPREIEYKEIVIDDI
jgi:5'-3' exonuclease